MTRKPRKPRKPRRTLQASTRAIYLARLARLVRMERDYKDDLNEIGVALIYHAIAATYQDACTFGGTREAQDLLATRTPAA